MNPGWKFLVDPIMSEGGYVRYDGRKSEQILCDCQMLLDGYRGKLTVLHDRSNNSRDLEDKLLKCYGVSPITVNIFLRKLRPYWKHADPSPLPRVTEVDARLGLDLDTVRRKTASFTRIEADVIRLRKRKNLSA